MGAESKKTGLLALYLLLALISSVSGQSPSSCSYSFTGNKQYASCMSLPHLSCYLHWTYNASAATADIAFRATNVTVSSTGNWVAWALNPTAPGMVGAQALVAYKNSSGSMWAYTSSVESKAISTLTESALSFTVTELTAESSGSQIIIFAKIQVPDNKTSVNHVWQVGPLSGDSPAPHSLSSDHLSSLGTLHFLSNVSQASPPVAGGPASPPPPAAGGPASPPPPAAGGPASPAPPTASGSSLTKESVIKLTLSLCLLAAAFLP